MEWWIVVIVLASLALAGFVEWLKFKGKQEKLGASTRELDRELEALRTALAESEQARAKLERRVQNLETIVTSESWDALVAGEAPDGLASETRPERPVDDEATVAQAERLARRLRG